MTDPGRTPILWLVSTERREVVLAALRAARWIRADAAKALGISRQALYQSIARLGIELLPPHPDVLGEARGRGPRPPRRRTVAA